MPAPLTLLLVEATPGAARRPSRLLAESDQNDWVTETAADITTAVERLDAGGVDLIWICGESPLDTLHELHALMAPRPFLVSGGSEDQPERWKALNHAVAVNEFLGYTNRVAMTNRSGHSPTPESNKQIYLFFEYFLRDTPAGDKKWKWK